MASKALLLLGLLFALVCFVSSEVATQQLAAKDAEKNVEDQKYGGGYPGGGYPGRGGGGYPGGGYPGRGGGGYPGGGYPGHGGGGYPGGGYPGHGGGGYPGHGGGGYPGHGGGGCHYGCCRRGYHGCICCGSADEVPEPEYQPEVNN